MWVRNTKYWSVACFMGIFATEDPRAKNGNGAGDIWGTAVRNKRVPISGFMGSFATEDRDEELKTI